MRIELDVDLRPTGPGPVAGEKPVVDPEARADKQRRDREERMLRRIALARVIEDWVATCKYADLADAARQCRVSRAQISQLSILQQLPRSVSSERNRPTRLPILLDQSTT